jgi:butyrate kinase
MATDISNALVLAINPGAVSLKLALFRGPARLVETEDPFDGALDDVVRQSRDLLQTQGVELSDLSAVVGRGGFIGPVHSGTWLVDQTVLDNLRTNRYGKHASNLGGLAASAIAGLVPCKALVVDPVCSDDLDDEVRVTGLREIRRRTAYHALNHGAVGRRLARKLGKPYGECLLLVAHLGSGISVAAHRRGRVPEVNNGLEGEGPFAPTRAGQLMVVDAVRHLRGLPDEQLYRLVTRQGGFVSLFGTADALEVESRITGGDQEARLCYRAFEYRVAREIASQSVALGGPPEAIGLTGGLARWERLTSGLEKRIGWLAPVHVFPGSFEMTALAEGALRVLSGEEEALSVPAEQ